MELLQIVTDGRGSHENLRDFSSFLKSIPEEASTPETGASDVSSWTRHQETESPDALPQLMLKGAGEGEEQTTKDNIVPSIGGTVVKEDTDIPQQQYPLPLALPLLHTLPTNSLETNSISRPNDGPIEAFETRPRGKLEFWSTTGPRNKFLPWQTAASQFGVSRDTEVDYTVTGPVKASSATAPATKNVEWTIHRSQDAPSTGMSSSSFPNRDSGVSVETTGEKKRATTPDFGPDIDISVRKLNPGIESLQPADSGLFANSGPGGWVHSETGTNSPLPAYSENSPGRFANPVPGAGQTPMAPLNGETTDFPSRFMNDSGELANPVTRQKIEVSEFASGNAPVLKSNFGSATKVDWRTESSSGDLHDAYDRNGSSKGLREFIEPWDFPIQTLPTGVNSPNTEFAAEFIETGSSATGTLSLESISHDIAGKFEDAVEGEWMSIAINPEELGPLQIRIDRLDDQLLARITATNPDTLQWLETNREGLIESLSIEGVKLGEVTIAAGDRENTGFHRENEFTDQRREAPNQQQDEQRGRQPEAASATGTRSPGKHVSGIDLIA